MVKVLCCVIGLLLVGIVSGRAQAAGRSQTIIYDGKAFSSVSAEAAEKSLWITTKDLEAATGFHIKPQGICRDELCFAIPAKRKAEFISKRGAVSWFNLTEFAALVKQPVAHDDKSGTWYFGKREDERGAYLASLEAPNFTLPDVNGKMHSLADYRGKKVLLITWASW